MKIAGREATIYESTQSRRAGQCYIGAEAHAAWLLHKPTARWVSGVAFMNDEYYWPTRAAAEAFAAEHADDPLTVTLTEAAGVQAERVHDLKTWPEYFEKILDGSKRFELRTNDRDFREGDVLRLREWRPTDHEYTGREIGVRVTYLTTNTNWLNGHSVAMSIEPLPAAPAPLAEPITAECYLTEDDPPEDHDLKRFSAVCGKCYGALADLEREAREQIAALSSEDGEVRRALNAAWEDIQQWCQLAQRQHDELKPVGHHPLAPTPAGIKSSRRVQELIARALKLLVSASP